MFAVRYLLPIAIIACAGLVLIFRGTDDNSLWGAASLLGAGLSVFFLNWLFRMGHSGDVERQREAAAREFLEKHGHWPDEAPPR
jgi:hypothetical protein